MAAERGPNVNLCVEAGCKFPCCCRGVRGIQLKPRDEFPGTVTYQEMTDILAINPNAKVAAIVEPYSILDLPTGGLSRTVLTPNGCPQEGPDGNCLIYDKRPWVCEANKRGGQLCADAREDYDLSPVEIYLHEIE